MLNATYLDRENAVTLVFLHGIFGKNEQLQFFFDLPYNIIAVDLPGHGKSSSCSTSSVLTCVRERLQETLNHYNIKEHVLFGYSLGGYIVADLLAHGWECAGAVILSAGVNLPRLELMDRFHVLSHAQRILPEYQELFERAVDTFRRLHEVPFSVRGELDVSEALMFLGALKQAERASSLSSVRCPVLLLHGKKDVVVPSENSHELKKQFSNARLIEFDSLDHGSVLRSDQVRSAIQEFVHNLSLDQ